MSYEHDAEGLLPIVLSVLLHTKGKTWLKQKLYWYILQIDHPRITDYGPKSPGTSGNKPSSQGSSRTPRIYPGSDL